MKSYKQFLAEMTDGFDFAKGWKENPSMKSANSRGWHLDADPVKLHQHLLKHGWKPTTHYNNGDKMATGQSYHKPQPYGSVTLEPHYKMGRVFYITYSSHQDRD